MSHLKILIHVLSLVVIATKAQNVNSSNQPKSGGMSNMANRCQQIMNPKMLGRTNTWRNQTWPNGRVPYVLDKTLTGNYLQAFYSALNQFYEKTCVRFVPKTATDSHYILAQVSKDNKYCGLAATCYWSMPNQFIQISQDCAASEGPWAHELSHTLCLHHEHERLDRNEFLTFDQCPVESIPGIIHDQDDLGTLYDYNSILHYICWGECWGRPTKKKGILCGGEVQNKGLSILDIDKLNLIYNCGWCHRRRWYSVYRAYPDKIATFVDFSSLPGDQARGPIYACRGYVGDEGEVAVGTCEPGGIHGWRCLIAWKGRAVVVEGNFELLGLPYGTNKVAIKEGGTKDLDYRLVRNTDESVKSLYIAGGRTDFDKKIYIGIVHAKTGEGGQMGTYVGKVYDQEAAAWGHPQNKALVVVQGKYFEASDYFVVACS